MDIIDERIIILILFVVISGVKWFIEKIKAQGDQQPDDNSEALEDIYESYREEIRKRQTARHRPEDEPQTEIQPRRDTPPPMPQSVPQLIPEPALEPSPEPTYQPAPVPQPPQVQKPQLTEEEKLALANLQQRTTKTRRRASGTANPSIRAMLSDPGSTRKAIILHEILGKPRSTQNI